jgi:hypothetical protein
MPAAYQNLYMEQGTTFNTVITLDDVYGNLYNLQSYTASSQMRYSYYAANSTATFTTSIDTINSTIALSLDAPTTRNIAAGRYVYDTIIIDPAQTVTRILEGTIEVSPSVTR